MVMSGSAGRSGAGESGADATVVVEGTETAFDVVGQFEVSADGELASSHALLEARPGEGLATSHIGGPVNVMAAGIGNHAAAGLLGASALAINGDIQVEAIGLGTQARLDLDNLAGFDSSVTVEANAAQTSAAVGAFAYLRASTQSNLGSQAWTINPVTAVDIAVLDVAAADYGGTVQLGVVGSMGTAYLQLSDELVTQVNIGSDLSRGVIALSMEDADYSNEAIKASVMSVDGFREGFDKLKFDIPAPDSQAWKGYITNISGSVEAQLDYFLAEATLELSGHTDGGFVTTIIDGHEFIAFDYDGSGLTGLVKLEDIDLPIDVSILATTQPVPVEQSTDVSTLPVTETINAASAETDSGNIEKNALSISANALERQILNLVAGNGNVSAGDLLLSADGYRSEAEAVLAASGTGADIAVKGDLGLVATGQSGMASMFAASKDSVVIEKNFTANAQTAHSVVNFRSRFAELMEVRGTFGLEAKGEYSVATAALVGISGSSVGPHVDLKADVALSSVGFRSVSSLEISHLLFGETRVGGNVTIHAMGDESSALVSDDLQGGKIALAKDLVVRAGGTYAEAGFKLRNDPPAGAGDVTPAHAVGGKLTAEANGAGSSSIIDFALTGRNDISVGGAVSSTATGYQATTELNLSTWYGTVSLPTLTVHASGVASHAMAMLKAGETPVAGVPSLTAGQLAIAGAVSVRATALGAQADAVLDVPNGEISVAGVTVDAAAASSVSNLAMQTGSTWVNSEDVELSAGPGKLTVSGDTEVRAAGADSVASLLASSENDTLTFGGSLKLIASGAEGQATLDAHASSAYLEAVVLGIPPGAKLAVAGDLNAIASNTRATVTANLESEMDELRIGGNLKALASGEQASSSVGLIASGGNLVLSGELAALSTGNASLAEVRVLSDNWVWGSSLNSPGHIEVAGDVSLIASGVNAISNVSLLARNGYSSLMLRQDVSIHASGIGSAATLVLSDTARLAESNDLTVDGMVRMAASAAASSANAELTSTKNDVSIGGLSMSAGGSESQMGFNATANGSLSLSDAGLQVLASGYDSEADVTLSASTGTLTVNGGVSLIATGDASDIEATLTSASAALAIQKDVSATALGDGSRISVTLSQSAGAAVAVAGQIQLLADSGNGSSAGATTVAALSVGSFGTKDFDLVMSAVQSTDHAETSLQLASYGGGIKIGGASQRGTAELTLTSSALGGDGLVEKIDIDFAGTSGQAVLHFDVDQDHQTSSGLQKVTLSGFRLDSDELHFGNLSGLDYETGITTAATFTSAALEHFNDAPGAGVFAGGSENGSTTFIAYDLDGSGVSAILVLEGVNINDFADKYQTPTGLG